MRVTLKITDVKSKREAEIQYHNPDPKVIMRNITTGDKLGYGDLVKQLERNYGKSKGTIEVVGDKKIKVLCDTNEFHIEDEKSKVILVFLNTSDKKIVSSLFVAKLRVMVDKLMKVKEINYRKE